MGAPVVFALQFVWFLAVWTVLARFVVWPWSSRLAPEQAVAAWLAPQMFRVLGLGLLVPALSPDMPAAFAAPTAAADLLTAVVALVGFVALRRGARGGIFLAWACSIIGLADLLHALVRAPRLGVVAHLAAQWYVPAAGVPLMIVSHVACILSLLNVRASSRGGRE